MCTKKNKIKEEEEEEKLRTDALRKVGCETTTRA
jgi:hypothetical protein